MIICSKSIVMEIFFSFNKVLPLFLIFYFFPYSGLLIIFYFGLS